LLIAGRLPRWYEAPASGHIHCPLVSETGVIAMQKVVGSNPISRFFANPLHVGWLVLARVAEIKWNHPRISPPFWALVPKMTPMRAPTG
jgi:hypothetical protein